MNTTITAKTLDISYTRSEDLHYAETMVSTAMNLSEELATSIAQHHLSTELGCDLERVEGWSTEATCEGTDWFVTFTGDDEDEDED